MLPTLTSARVERQPPVQLTPDLLRAWPLPVDAEGDKHSRGTVLVVAGSTSCVGPALLAGTAALRMGAGRLQIATVAPVAIGVSLAMPEALVIPLGVDDRGLVSADAAGALEDHLAGARSVLFGPGLDPSGALGPVLERLIEGMASDAVLVADAAAFVALRSIGRSVLARVGGRLVLTPNREELRRLADPRSVSGSEPELGPIVAESYRAVVTSFGNVDSDDGRRWSTSAGAPGLATSGSGDVLAGLVAGAAARRTDPAQAACWATYVHVATALRLGQHMGATSFLARELADEVPFVMAEFEG